MYNNGRKEGGIVLKFEVGEILEITVSECSSPNCVVVDYDRKVGFVFLWYRIMNNSVRIASARVASPILHTIRQEKTLTKMLYLLPSLLHSWSIIRKKDTFVKYMKERINVEVIELK